jgi:hypothetical protein
VIPQATIDSRRFLNRIAQAKAETSALLTAALRYMPANRMWAQVEFYQAHIEYLDHLARGEDATPPTADLEHWHEAACVRDARLAKV